MADPSLHVPIVNMLCLKTLAASHGRIVSAKLFVFLHLLLCIMCDLCGVSNVSPMSGAPLRICGSCSQRSVPPTAPTGWSCNDGRKSPSRTFQRKLTACAISAPNRQSSRSRSDRFASFAKTNLTTESCGGLLGVFPRISCPGLCPNSSIKRGGREHSQQGLHCVHPAAL